MSPTCRMDSFVIAFVIAVMSLSTALGQQNCPEDYSPCTCDAYQEGWQVTCTRIPLAQVQQVFTRTTTNDIVQAVIELPVGEDVVPVDLLNDKRVSEIMLACPTRNHLLMVDTEAFRLTKNVTERFILNNCDLSQLSFDFLTGFDNLVYLDVYLSSNIHQSGFSALPRLPQLSSLLFYLCTGLEEWVDYPVLVRGLVFFYVNSNVGDETLNRMLNWVLSYSGGETLELLSLNRNQLTAIPSQITSLPKLYYLNIGNNHFPIIQKGSIQFSAPVYQLDISDSQVDIIEPNAFQGDFGGAIVRLERNNLTRFEASVFKEMLQQMSQSSGTIHLSGNPIDCNNDPCHLSWLFRDEPGLLKSVNGGECSNGTTFEELDPAGFSNCL